MDCKFLYPYGANGGDGATAYTGHQMTFASSWIRTMVYRRCLFDGASLGTLDVATCPGRRLMDGGHFGGPMELIFEENETKYFSVEGVFKLFDYILDTNATSFIIPPADGHTAATAQLSGRDSAFPKGMKFYVLYSGYFIVDDYNPSNHVLTFHNSGDAINLAPGTVVPAGRILYPSSPPIVASRIVNNVFNGTPPAGSPVITGKTGPGSPAIATNDSLALIQNNLIIGCKVGISTYAHTIPDQDFSKGTIIANNIIETADPYICGLGVTGIYVPSDETFVIGNKITSPRSYGVNGLTIEGRNNYISRNAIESLTAPIGTYNDSYRGTGICIGNRSLHTVVQGNSTKRFAVGIGTQPNQNVPYQVGKHANQEDTLAIDYRFDTIRLTLEKQLPLDRAGRNTKQLRAILGRL